MNRTFGIEIEAYGIAIGRVADIIIAAGIPCRSFSYAEHTDHATWKVVTDGSVAGGWEVVSPILSGDEGIEQVRTVMNALTAAGAKVNKSCGLHVHIGARDFTMTELRNIARNYVIFEDFFDNIMPPSRRASVNPYVKSNRNKFGGYGRDATARAIEAIAGCRRVDDLIETMNPRVGMVGLTFDRYFKLNLTAYHKHGTIEFRQHSGTTDADKAAHWIRLLLQFVNRAAKTRQRFSVERQRTAVQTFAAFFRCFGVEKIDRQYFTGRRRGFFGDDDSGAVQVSHTMRRQMAGAR